MSSLRTPIRLHDGVESIGADVFAYCIFANFRVPPLITVIPDGMLQDCKSIFPICSCKYLLSTKCGLSCQRFLQRLCPPQRRLRYCSVIRKQIRELMHRFVGLLIHKLVYYQTYNQGVLLVLRSQFDPTSNNQDCLGMTPLHILACSSVHDLEVYCVIVEMYPANLITEDRWDATTALCIFGGCAD